MPRKLRLAKGDAIRQLRLKLGLSQADFAARFDVAERWISKIERSEGPVDECALRELADKLGVAFDDIVVPEGEEESHLQAKSADISDNSGGVSTLVGTEIGILSITASPSMSEEEARNLGMAIKHLLSLSATRKIQILPERG